MRNVTYMSFDLENGENFEKCFFFLNYFSSILTFSNLHCVLNISPLITLIIIILGLFHHMQNEKLLTVCSHHSLTVSYRIDFKWTFHPKKLFAYACILCNTFALSSHHEKFPKVSQVSSCILLHFNIMCFN